MEELFKNPHRVKQQYLQWLNDNISVIKSNDDVVEIQTPFLNHFNDWIYIYLVKKDNNLYLSDGGNTLNELELSGVKLNTDAKKRIMNNFLIVNGLSINNDVIIKKTSVNTLAQDKHTFIQGILSINDMFILNRTNIRSLFIEEVKKYFDEIGVRYSTEIGLIGRSGLQHIFNFIIPKSNQFLERIIYTINNLNNKEKVDSTLMKFIDIRDIRRDTIGVVIINDIDNNIKNEYIEAFNNYEIKPILFSKISEYQAFLAN